jgi:AcrR family transcriptional regulator
MDLGVREQQKQATRLKVLTAARDLFDETGYADTTIRAIAQRAGVSVGSVFTTFISKADILSQVVLERMHALQAELERVAPHLRGSTPDRLCSLFAIHYEFQMRQANLYLAYIGASFSTAREEGFVRFGANPGLRAQAHGILKGGVERGDIPPGADLDFLLDTALALYGFNYLRVAEGADAAALTAVIDRQLKLLFDGLAPGAGVNPSL